MDRPGDCRQTGLCVSLWSQRSVRYDQTSSTCRTGMRLTLSMLSSTHCRSMRCGWLPQSSSRRRKVVQSSSRPWCWVTRCGRQFDASHTSKTSVPRWISRRRRWRATGRRLIKLTGSLLCADWRHIAGRRHRVTALPKSLLSSPWLALHWLTRSVSRKVQYVSEEVHVRVRDGTRLVGDLYRCGDIAAPTVLRRTPYERWPAPAGGSLDHERLLRAGYHLLVQSVRGRHGSGGSFEPYVAERHDGADTIEWIAGQEWSDGVVGMVGRSYDAATQWLVAQDAPVALKAMVPQFGAAQFSEGWTWYGGARQLGFLVDWLLGDFVVEPAKVPDLYDVPPDPRSAHDRVAQVLEALEVDCPWLTQWWRQPPNSRYWSVRSARLDNVHAACLHVGGWYDIFLSGTLQAYESLVRLQRAGHGVGQQALVIGPWSHDNQTGRFGERDFGPAADVHAWDLTGRVIDFFHDHLQPRPTSVSAQPFGVVFDLGSNQWHSVAEWPGDTVALDMHLAPGNLDLMPPAKDELSLPTWPLAATGGGRHAMAGVYHVPAGPVDVIRLPGAPVLVFKSSPVVAGMLLDGRLHAEIWATSQANCADLAAELILCRGITRDVVGSGICRFGSEEVLTVPSLAVVDLGATRTTLRAGDVLELVLAAGSYPRFDPSPSCGEDDVTIHVGGACKSKLVLPLSQVNQD